MTETEIEIETTTRYQTWEAVLGAFAPVRVATPRQIERATGLSRNGVALTLKRLVNTAPDTEPFVTRVSRRVAYRAWDPTASTVYRLGSVGAAWLRQHGRLPDGRPSEQTDPHAIAQSLCLLDLVLLGRAQGQAGLQAERVFTNSAGASIRADIAVPMADGAWHVLEVEREANADNFPRRLKRLESLHRFFSQPAVEPVASDLLVLFNVKAEHLAPTVAGWQGALAELQRLHPGPLPFTLHYTLLPTFLAEPHWTSCGEHPQLEPQAPVAAPEMPAADPLATVAAEPDLCGFFQQANAIYQLSRGEVAQASEFAVPVEALQALRCLLAGPAWQTVRQEWMDGLAQIRLQAQPQTNTVLLTKMIWEIVLRHYGIDRVHLGTSDLQISAVERQPVDGKVVGYGDYHVRVALSTGLYEALSQGFPEPPHLRMLETSAEWMLGALFTYAYELGLRPTPWWKRAPAQRGRKKAA